MRRLFNAPACILVAYALASAGCTVTSTAPPRTIVIGVMLFNGQYILGEMVALLLKQEDNETEVRSGMNNAGLYEATKAGIVDAYVDYTSAPSAPA
ncbi:MAG: glycine betaine ABC transporter substrate-binding protein [Methanolinea sp.]|nr:glycine betaine ABC transporter substrate-binding protein [Methanolinea sp.]